MQGPEYDLQRAEVENDIGVWQPLLIMIIMMHQSSNNWQEADHHNEDCDHRYDITYVHVVLIIITMRMIYDDYDHDFNNDPQVPALS